MNRLVILVFSMLPVIVGCQDASNESETSGMEVKVYKAEDVPGVEFLFVKYVNNDKETGRQAEFRIRNASKRVILAFRGTVIGYDENDKEVYAFPYSMAEIPSLLKIGAERTEPMGFEIPDTVKRVVFSAEEYDAI
jgi:hypothetical protein